MSTTAARDKPVDKNMIEVTVFTLNTTEGKSFTWKKTMKVREASAEAAAAFGIDDANARLSKDGKVLDRDKPLVAAGVEDGDELELVSTGGGV